MSGPAGKTVTLSALNAKFKSRFDLYGFLSQKYKLPNYNSRAITTSYLKAYLKNPCPIFRITRDKFTPPFIITRHVNAAEVLAAIEKELKKQHLPPTGLNEQKLPDFEWLIGVYFHLSPNDDQKIFPKTIKQENLVTRTIDPESEDFLFFFLYYFFFFLQQIFLNIFRMAKLLEEVEPKKRGRSIFQLLEEEKTSYQQTRLEKKKQRQQESKRIIEERKKFLEKKIEKTETLLSKFQESTKKEQLNLASSALESLRVRDTRTQLFGCSFLI